MMFYQRTAPGINLVVEPLETENEVSGTSGNKVGESRNPEGGKFNNEEKSDRVLGVEEDGDIIFLYQ